MPPDAPQPGRTPGTESTPRALSDPARSWWAAGPEAGTAGDDAARPRHPRRRPPQNAAATAGDSPPGEATTAADTTGVAVEPEPTVRQRAATEVRTEPNGVECDHNRPDPFRYDPLSPPAGYSGMTGTTADAAPAETPATDQPAPKAEPEAEAAPAAPAEEVPRPDGPAPEPDVMILPDPDDRNRPTVALDRAAVPGQGRVHPAEPLPPPTGDPVTDARLRKLENSPFWLDESERSGSRRLPEISSHSADRRHRGRRSVIRRPAPALLALITLALVATFFAWVSAEPFWLAVGHGDRGYATTTACRGTGVAQRCIGRFDAADGSYTVARVTLLGVTGDQRTVGTVTAARMVSPGSHTAYLGDTGLLVHLRWVLGFLLVLLCGYAIAGLTGAGRLDEARSRRLVVLASLAAPVVLLAGFLAATY